MIGLAIVKSVILPRFLALTLHHQSIARQPPSLLSGFGFSRPK